MAIFQQLQTIAPVEKLPVVATLNSISHRLQPTRF
jgi:hypothetical protein